MFMTTAAAVLLAATGDNYWWKYAGKDCNGAKNRADDVVPQPECRDAAKGDVTKLEACCLATKGCSGFNTNGIMKASECESHIDDTWSGDLYILHDKPQPPPPPPPPANMPWPIPKKYTAGTTNATVSSSFKFVVANGACKTLTTAVARYQTLTFPHAAATAIDARDSTDITSLEISVDNNDESHPQFGDDESYTLNVISGASTLKAATVYGAMKGLETFSQLVQFDFDSQSYNVKNSPWAIDDAPRFPHRGLMIDTARHFETLPAIRAIVDSLAYAKCNVLHWHMSDTQSFPFQSKTYPKLWEGAYSAQEKYTQADIAAVVEYARERGIRVMVEFDMPGHAGSWCKGYPEICPSESCNQPLNVANNFTFDLIAGVLKECTGGATSTKGSPSGLFPDNFIHLGGDEVNTACWTKTPAIAKWLKKQGMSADDGYAYFVKRAASIALAQGRNPVQWSEVYDHFKNKLDKKTIVHVWKSVTNVTEVVADGYRVIRNVGYNSISWYLDNLDVKWDKVYQNDPCAGVPHDLCDKFVIGGHGEMWGETVDASDVEQTVWPRQAAIAERLWSPRSYKDPAQAHDRIKAFRCLLNRRGVRAAPVENANARSAPPGPGSCYDQR